MTGIPRMVGPEPRVRLGTASRPAKRSDSGTIKEWLPAAIVIAVFSVRLADVVPVLPNLRPAILVLLTIVPWAFNRANPQAVRDAFRDKTTRLVLIYVGIAVFGIPFAIYRRAAFDGIEGLLFGTLVVVVTLLTPPTRKNMEALAWTFLLSTAAMGLLTLMRGVYDGGRLTTGVSLDPNDLASAMAVAFPFAVVRMIRDKGLQRFLGIVAGLVAIVVLLQTGSRGGLVGIAAGTLTLFAGLRASRIFVLGVILATAVPIFWAKAPPVFKERVASMTTLGEDYNLTEDYGRIATWRRGIGYTFSHPITGVGMENFSVAEGVRFMRLKVAAPWHTAHNTYIQAFAELGFPGGIVLMILLFYAFRTGARFWRVSPAEERAGIPDRPEYLSAMMAFATAGFFLSHAYTFLLFGLLALFAHADRVSPAPAPKRSRVRRLM